MTRSRRIRSMGGLAVLIIGLIVIRWIYGAAMIDEGSWSDGQRVAASFWNAGLFISAIVLLAAGQIIGASTD